jgi:hypothetical protein
MTLSMPFAFPISSATDFTPLPAMKAVIEPPSFVPAVTAASEAGWNLPSFCSRTANVEAKRANAEYCGAAVGCARRSAVRNIELRAAGSMVEESKGAHERNESGIPGYQKCLSWREGTQRLDLRTWSIMTSV